MKRLQTIDEWMRRTEAMRAALETIGECLASAPTVNLTPGASYRIRLAGNVVQGDGTIALDDVGKWAAGAGEKTIEGRFCGRLPAPAVAGPVTVAHGSIVLEISKPKEKAGKHAVFADMDVLEYEGLGLQ